MIDFGARPHSDQTGPGQAKTFKGQATCSKAHKWPVTWTFVKTGRFFMGRSITESRQVVVPELCPTCSGKALTLKPSNKSKVQP